MSKHPRSLLLLWHHPGHPVGRMKMTDRSKHQSMSGCKMQRRNWLLWLANWEALFFFFALSLLELAIGHVPDTDSSQSHTLNPWGPPWADASWHRGKLEPGCWGGGWGESPPVSRKSFINTQGPNCQPAWSSKLFYLKTDMNRGQSSVKDLIRGWTQVPSLKSWLQKN